MIDYFVTNEHGCVVSVGRVPEAHLDLQRCAGFRVGVAEVGDYVDADGKVHPLPVAPSAAHVFDYTTQRYTLDADKVRAMRNALLVRCDWTQLPDVPLATREAWAKYRQALRDVTEQARFPSDVVWPVAPK